MLQYSIYSVISPEGCASILWKDASKAPDAAAAMGVTADKVVAHELVDAVLPEPLGGAHRDLSGMSADIAQTIRDELRKLQALPTQELINRRYQKWMAMGAYPSK
ncbi:MAG TPA: hypothetical protein DCZ80_06955 [Legionellales bacterium]|nr:hypothetical protein [Legionellales bacterium]